MNSEYFSDEHLKAIRTMYSDMSDVDFQRFIQFAETKRLDPLSRQIYPTWRWNDHKKSKEMAVECTIDGQRVIAERNGNYAGQVGPFWCGPDGVWHEVWLNDEFPVACKVGILRKDFKEPLYAVARFRDYVQTKKNGDITAMWSKMGVTMIAKCTESLGLRRAFPHDLSGIYVREEMMQASHPDEKDEKPSSDPEPSESDPSQGEGDLPWTRNMVVQKLRESGFQDKQIISMMPIVVRSVKSDCSRYDDLDQESKRLLCSTIIQCNFQETYDNALNEQSDHGGEPDPGPGSDGEPGDQ